MGLEPQPLPPELPGPGDDMPPSEVPTPTYPEPGMPPHPPEALPSRPPHP
jgi:hypothetical protein